MNPAMPRHPFSSDAVLAGDAMLHSTYKEIDDMGQSIQSFKGLTHPDGISSMPKLRKWYSENREKMNRLRNTAVETKKASLNNRTDAAEAANMLSRVDRDVKVSLDAADRMTKELEEDRDEVEKEFVRLVRNMVQLKGGAWCSHVLKKECREDQETQSDANKQISKLIQTCKRCLPGGNVAEWSEEAAIKLVKGAQARIEWLEGKLNENSRPPLNNEQLRKMTERATLASNLMTPTKTFSSPHPQNLQRREKSRGMEEDAVASENTVSRSNTHNGADLVGLFSPKAKPHPAGNIGTAVAHSVKTASDIQTVGVIFQ
ncbi:hypothetical protein BDZ45DRAFT_751119 [Acephala macrosclerotiorum]|nr:hypothetical protein BDZ45DRAFT_751119 [Acephala macrosclerotiorum]